MAILPSWFVPLSAYGVQLGLAVIGAGILLMVRPAAPRWLLAASAYPVGAAVAGLAQWIAFVAGVGGMAVPAIAALGVISTYPVINRVRRAGNRLPVLPTILTLVVLSLGLLVSQSGPLAESDPRFQIGYRAKIIASSDGFVQGEYWSNPEILHINPKYPLLMSSLQAVTLRLAGQSIAGSEIRAVSFAFFASFVILLAGYSLGVAGAVWGNVPLLIAVCIPRLWTTALDEGYSDFPLGVYLATALAWATREPSRLVIGLCGLAVAGIKTEGAVAACVFAVAMVVHWRYSGLRLGLAMVGGAVLSYVLFRLGVAQTAGQMPMENVQFHEITPDALLAGIARWPIVLGRFAELLLSPSSFGFFFPLAAFAAIGAGRFGRTVFAAAMVYLALLTVPFLVTRLPLDFHLNSTIPRFGFQVIPALCLGSAECVSRNWFQRFEVIRFPQV